MAAELFANLAETTLSAGYTAGAGSISVTSASGFPSTGVFRVRLGNTGKTIFRVDSVSGTTFTGAAEANDANANSGDSVIVVATRAVAERLVQAPSSGEIHAYSGVSGADRYLGLVKIPPIVAADYAWTNQGTASVTESGGTGVLAAPTATTNVRLRRKAITPPFTVSACFEPEHLAGVNSEMGFMLRESGTDKMYAACTRDASIISTVRYASVTSLTDAPVSLTGRVVNRRLWFRFVHDGTNISAQYSYDGVNYIQLESRGKTTAFTTDCDQVGYFICQRGSGVTQTLYCLGIG